MKLKMIIFTLVFTIHYSIGAGNSFAGNQHKSISQDTIKLRADSIDKALNDVIKSATVPKMQTVKYVNQVTKYGFKNLFRNLSYNSLMPYSSQVNPYAERYMQDYLQGHKNYLQKMKGTSQLYFNLIDNIFAQYGLPKELKYLAVIESNLKTNALSWMGARGPWQFMTYTARDYGLKVNGYTDERTDYYKSTNAAARYLLYLYRDLKDWLLVIAAYNGGPGRVYNAIKKSGSRNFWSLQNYLPTESRNHVKKFIATHYIMEGNTDHPGNFDYSVLSIKADTTAGPVLSENDINGTTVLTVSGKYRSPIVAKNLEIEMIEFNRLNPGFDELLALGNDFPLRLSQDKMDLFVARKYVILNECVQVLLNDVNEPTKTKYNRYSISKPRRSK